MYGNKPAPFLGSNLTSEECHYTPQTLPANYLPVLASQLRELQTS